MCKKLIQALTDIWLRGQLLVSRKTEAGDVFPQTSYFIRSPSSNRESLSGDSSPSPRDTELKYRQKVKGCVIWLSVTDLFILIFWTESPSSLSADLFLSWTWQYEYMALWEHDNVRTWPHDSALTSGLALLAELGSVMNLSLILAWAVLETECLGEVLGLFRE